MNFNPKLAGTLLLLFGLSGCASTTPSIQPDYEFEELEKVKSVRNHNVDGWAPINDQALIMSTSPRTSYLVILVRPDHNLVFSHRLGVTSKGGDIMAKFDEVYAMNSGIKVGIPIKAIYKLTGKEQKELAIRLVEEAEKEAEEANEEATSD